MSCSLIGCEVADLTIFYFYHSHFQDRYADLFCRFMWVRAQVDYLQRLPTDSEKRKALKRLPPDLPQTYVRILEIIDSTYPPPTTEFIQRILRWLVLGKSGDSNTYPSGRESSFTSRMLCQAVCLENESEGLCDSEILTEQQILGWLGCLVRKSKSEETIELSHFTIKEFLKMDPGTIASAVARKYLVQLDDYNHLVKVCLTHLMHAADFTSMKWSMFSEIGSFIRDHPLYRHAMIYLCDYIKELNWTSAGMKQKVKCIMQRFLSIPVHEAFLLWDKCCIWATEMDMPSQECKIESYLSPLHFASLLGLMDEVQSLCRHGLDPNCTVTPMDEREFAYTPLHLALLNNTDTFNHCSTYLWHQRIEYRVAGNDVLPEFWVEAKLQIIRTLLDAGANVHQQLVIGLHTVRRTITPLSLALLSGFWAATCILLDEGADFSSINTLLNNVPKLEESVQHAVDSRGHQGLKRVLERWREGYVQSDEDRDGRSIGESDDHSMKEIDCSTSPQERFIDAYRNGRWSVVRELLEAESEIEINCHDEQGTNLLFCASDAPSEDLCYILERGANPKLLTTSGLSVLCKTVVRGCLENMSLLLDFGANIEHQDPRG